MTEQLLTRQQILSALREALEPLNYTHAMWEAGAAAFNRLDEWSDIDLQIDVDDECVEQTFEVVEATLLKLSPIDARNRIPDPTWHGHSQTFYRLANASPYLLIDLSVSKQRSRDKFLQREIHGEPVVHFDKSNVIQLKPLDREAFVAKLRERVEKLRSAFDLNKILVTKEIHRGNTIEAVSFYTSFTLRPLVEALGIKYRPARYSFFTRYVQYDMPEDVVRRLERLFFVGDPAELAARNAEGVEWFNEIITSIDFDEVERRLGEG